MSWWHNLFFALGLAGRPGRALGATLVAAAVGISGAAIYSQTNGGSGTFPLQDSANGRYLQSPGGTPFLIVGDSAQAMMGNLDSTHVQTYLDDRESYGFNALWVEMPCAAPICNSNGTTYDGIKPFNTGTTLSNYDLATPNSTYFARAHDYAARALDNGIAIFFDPSAARDCAAGTWLTTLLNNGTTKAFDYGAYLGDTFKDLPNVNFINGNDYSCYANSTDDAVMYALAQGIQSTDPAAIQTLQTYWSDGYNEVGRMSVDDTTNDWRSVLTLNGAYTYAPGYAEVLNAYNASPTLPAYMQETNYEDQHSPNTDGCLVARSCRLQEWWTMTSGASGQFYGLVATWSFTNSVTQGQYDTTPAQELKYQTDLLKTLAWKDLVPDQAHTFLFATSGSGNSCGTSASTGSIAANTYVSAAKTSDGTLALAYMPAPSGSQTCRVDLSQMAGSTTARWFDPTDGSYTAISGSPFANSGTHDFASPANNSAGDHDWALLLQSS